MNTADSQFEPIKTFDPDGIPGAELDVQASGAASENVLDVRESHRRRTLCEFRGIEHKLGSDTESPIAGIRRWHASAESVLLRQGLMPPPLVMQYVPVGRLVKRPFFQLFIPPTTYTQKEHCLFCRKKTNRNVYRLSLDPHNMSKRSNPLYCGKIEEQRDRPGQYIITLAKGGRLASVKLTESRTDGHPRRMMEVELLDSFVNEHEPGVTGRVFTAFVQANRQPQFTLQTAGGRPVCVLYKETDVTIAGGARGGGIAGGGDQATDAPAVERPISPSAESNKYFVDLDYPLNILLAFCISCIAESERLHW